MEPLGQWIASGKLDGVCVCVCARVCVHNHKVLTINTKL